MTDHSRLDATVYGHVQGVGFRWHVQRIAARLALNGWTANQSDGSVRVVAEGAPAVLEAFVTELHHGPPGAVVERVAINRSGASGEFTRFEIRGRGHRGD